MEPPYVCWLFSIFSTDMGGVHFFGGILIYLDAIQRQNCLLKDSNQLLETGLRERKAVQLRWPPRSKGVAIQPATSICLV